MNIKTKLTLGVGLLFLLIILQSIVGARYINALKADTENILVANYNSLEYSRNMMAALQHIGSGSTQKFEQNLQKQERNITEIGEQECTEDLRAAFEHYKIHPTDSAVLLNMQGYLFRVMDLNMQAIQRKSNLANHTASSATFWIVLTGTLCFLIAFVLLVNLPSNIANPIREITNSIKQIADENYSERVHFDQGDEFGELAKSFNRMAEKLEEFNSSNLAKLMMEKKRIDTLINNMNDPVIGLDEHYKVLFANSEAIKITGLKEEEFIGHQAPELAIKNDLIRMLLQDLLQPESVKSSKQKPLQIFVNDKEGYFEKQYLNISIVPTGEELQQLIGYVIVLRNVTEYKELDFAKTNFIATVSHELKTPLSSIKMSVQLLEDQVHVGALNEEQKNLVTSIEDDANRLLKITGELLNMTQVESGNIQLAILPTDPREILNYAINATKAQAEQKQIVFDLLLSEQLPKVQADNEKTAWVLTNLISNAIRYSHEHASISLRILSVDQRIKFVVKDTGQGIAPQYVAKVFDRYFRVPGTKKEGTGLGLAISKEFIEAQGGHIEVESKYGEGSTFTVTLNAVI